MDNAFSEITGVPVFNFQPHNYGPFDKSVADILEQLRAEGLVTFTPENTYMSYSLTSPGQLEGEKILNSIPEKPREYIKVLSDFIRKLSFTELVSIIYKAFPNMRIDSIPDELTSERISNDEHDQGTAEIKKLSREFQSKLESPPTIEIPKIPR